MGDDYVDASETQGSWKDEWEGKMKVP